MVSKESVKDIDDILVSSKIPLSTAHKYIMCASFPNVPIISVGSGTGEDEFKLQKLLNKKIITIDPGLLSPDEKFDEKKCIMPLFPTVKKMLESHAEYYKKDNKNSTTKDNTKKEDACNDLPLEIINNCCLFINWPMPNKTNDKVAQYAIDAIRILNPISIVIVYEITGAAGDIHLHAWLQNIIGKEPTFFGELSLADKKLFPEKEYKSMAKRNYDIPRLNNFTEQFQTEMRGKVQSMKPILQIINNPLCNEMVRAFDDMIDGTNKNRIVYLARKGTKVKKSLLDDITQK